MRFFNSLIFPFWASLILLIQKSVPCVFLRSTLYYDNV